ncbi:MAG: DUF423 domain-containing protein [Pirellulales bacterium]
MLKLLMFLGATLGMLAVIAGAMGEHELKSKLSKEHMDILSQAYPSAVMDEETEAEETEAEESEAEGEQPDVDSENTDPAVSEFDPGSDDSSELNTSTSKATAITNTMFVADKAKRLSNFRIAVQYQMYSAIAILFVSLLGSVSSRGKGTAVLSGLSFIIGTILFCGPMYVKSYLKIIDYGLYTPYGGIIILLGWGLLLLAAVQFKFDKEEPA